MVRQESWPKPECARHYASPVSMQGFHPNESQHLAGDMRLQAYVSCPGFLIFRKLIADSQEMHLFYVGLKI